MGILAKIFKKQSTTAETGWKSGGMEDFMMLIRVYYQAVMAARLGISNLSALPDLRVFKRTLQVPTVNNKLGIGEKNACRKMLQTMYGMSNNFFDEIDGSIKRNCKTMQDMQSYLYSFQGFSQELMMLMGNLMKWKFRLPGFMKSMLRAMTIKTVNQIMTKNNWKDDGVRKAVLSIRQYQRSLGYSENWMAEYVYNIVLLAKKEPKASVEEEK